MNDDKNKPSESSKPSHEAARVVIPFDIDMSAVEAKLGEIERRVSSLNGQKPPQQQQQDQRENDDEIRFISYNDINQAGQYYKGSSGASQGQDAEEEKHRTLMLSSINRMNDLLRQINDVVLLIYNQMMSGRNNG